MSAIAIIPAEVFVAAMLALLYTFSTVTAPFAYTARAAVQVFESNVMPRDATEPAIVRFLTVPERVAKSGTVVVIV